MSKESGKPSNGFGSWEGGLSPELFALSKEVKEAYKKCLVYEEALKYCNVSDEQRRTLEANRYYKADIERIEFDLKSLLTGTLQDIVSNGKNPERLTAIKLLGEVIYPEKFGKAETNNDNVKVEIYIPDNGRPRKEKK